MLIGGVIFCKTVDHNRQSQSLLSKKTLITTPDAAENEMGSIFGFDITFEMTWNRFNKSCNISAKELCTFKVDSSVECCWMLKNTRVCDDHLFEQVSTHSGRHHLPIFPCTNLHLRRYTHPLFRPSVFRWRHELQWAHNISHEIWL